MATNNRQYDYTFVNAQAGHHHAYLINPLLEMLAQVEPRPLRVLDLGCGNGSLSQQIAQQGYDVVGVEDSLLGIQFAHQSAPECHFIQASIYDLPYDELEAAFDVVIAAEVIEHMLYPRELIRAAKKCLKPKGCLILTTPYHGYWKNLALALTGKFDQHFNPLWDAGHVKFFSVTTLAALLKQEGLTTPQFKFAGRFPYLWKSMLCSSVMV